MSLVKTLSKTSSRTYCDPVVWAPPVDDEEENAGVNSPDGPSWEWANKGRGPFGEQWKKTGIPVIPEGGCRGPTAGGLFGGCPDKGRNPEIYKYREYSNYSNLLFPLAGKSLLLQPAQESQFSQFSLWPGNPSTGFWDYREKASAIPVFLLSLDILQKTIGALRDELGQDAVKVDGDRVWLKQDADGKDIATRPMDIPPRARESLVRYTEDKDLVTHWNLRTRRGQPSAADRRRNEEVNLALAALPSHKGIVYRRMKLFSDSRASAYMVGDIKTWKALSSASKVPQSGFGYQVEFRILSRRGRDVSGLSAKPEEREVLFRTGSRFRVAARRKEAEMWIIELEELAP